MRRTMVGAAVGLLVLAGCGGSPEPAQPPTQEEALTTATVAPPKPVDEVAATTDVATATTDPTGDTVGPPTLPKEAEEQTQEGAIAFAEHFVDIVNYTGIEPVPGMIANLSTDECQTCANLEETVVYSEENAHRLRENLWEVSGEAEVLTFAKDASLVRLPVRQIELPVYDESDSEVDRTSAATYSMALDLSWEDNSWHVRAVQFG